MPASVQQRMLFMLGVLGGLICCAYWLHAHTQMVAKFGYQLGARCVCA